MTHEEMLNAVQSSNAAYDGRFFYGVMTTGIFCRPSCASRIPNAENIVFFDTALKAQQQGYRPCKRCRPDLMYYQPVTELAEKMRGMIEDGYADKAQVFEQLKSLGVTPKRAIQIFREQFGATPGAYLNKLRVREAARQLRETNSPVIDIAFMLGFESVTAFYTFFGKHMGITPAAYRNKEHTKSGSYHSLMFDSGMGKILITADHEAVTGIHFVQDTEIHPKGEEGELTQRAADQLQEYFQGSRSSFTVPLKPLGSDFQKLVWSALSQIPYGQIKSYKQVAEAIKRPSASRAVGNANNKNPILIMIPCHRVVGSDGSLTGYAAGLAIKQRLLDLEQEHWR